MTNINFTFFLLLNVHIFTHIFFNYYLSQYTFNFVNSYIIRKNDLNLFGRNKRKTRGISLIKKT